MSPKIGSYQRGKYKWGKLELPPPNSKKIEVGDKVEWRANGKLFRGVVIEKNPKIAPGAEYAIKIGDEVYYPLAHVEKVRYD